MITGIEDLAIIVNSEKTVDFYLKLGFQEVFRKIRETDTVVILEGYGIKIVLFVDPTHPIRHSEPEYCGIRGFALKVDGIEKTAEELGLVISPISYNWIGTRYAYIKDPDGNPIQLHE